MTESGNGSKYPSWKWLAGILVGLLIIIGGYTLGTSIGEVKAGILVLQDKKLDKDQYLLDMKDMKDKIDCIYNWHLPPELRK